jgi:hypothetical protein
LNLFSGLGIKLSGRALAWPSQGPEFNLKNCQKKKKERKEKITLSEPLCCISRSYVKSIYFKN